MKILVTQLPDALPWAHADGCKHRKFDDARVIEADSRQGVADQVYADCIREGSMTRADALADVRFAPCAKGLS